MYTLVLPLRVVLLRIFNRLDLGRALPSSTKQIRPWGLPGVGLCLLALVGRTSSRVGLTTALLNLVACVLQHPLQLNLLGLLSMNRALEVLNHPVRVTKRAPQGFRLEVIVTRGELVGRWWRRILWRLVVLFIRVNIPRNITGAFSFLLSQAHRHSLGKLLVLRVQLLEFLLHCGPFEVP